MLEKISDTHTILNDFAEHASQLSNLEPIKNSLGSIENKLLASATGRDQMSTKTVLALLRIFTGIIVGLVFVIVFLLTGAHYGWINPLH